MSQDKQTYKRLLPTALAAILAMEMFSGHVAADTTNPQAVEHLHIGNVPVEGVALRDGVVVSRKMLHQTDAHAFADKTVIDEVQDAGTYGAFDATTELRGSNLQDHMISFQDRLKYSGSNAIKLLDGFMSHPVHAGTGKIYMRTGVDIGDMPITNGGTIDQNIGVLVQDIRSGSNNSAVVLSQSNGHTLYSSGTAPSYHRSMLFFGPGTGPVISADSTQAKDVRDLSRKELKVAAKLKTLIKASKQKGGGGKIHVGVMAQDVIEAFKSEGLDANEYAIVGKEGDVLGVRYDELLAFVVSAL